jgi:anti-sigma regulatory factor (Ser/Thr protein kinase)
MPRAATGLDLVTRARQWVRDAVSSSTLGAVDPEAVALVTSELVTNALMHANQPFDVTIDLENDRVRVEVWDSSPSTDAQRRGRTPGLADVGGWGLEIVSRLSDDWGVHRNGERKYVWAEFGAGSLPGV